MIEQLWVAMSTKVTKLFEEEIFGGATTALGDNIGDCAMTTNTTISMSIKTSDHRHGKKKRNMMGKMRKRGHQRKRIKG